MSRVLALPVILAAAWLGMRRADAAPYMGTATYMQLVPLEWYPDAVCNDGTPGGFWFAPATDPAKQNIWLIYLEGGQWCYDNSSCWEREQAFPYLTSSKNWYYHLYMGGIFDSDPRRSPFAGANMVYAAYCTSDAWVGNAGKESNDIGWYFRGQAMIEGLFDQLQKGFNYTTTTTVHYAINHTHAQVTTSVFPQLTNKAKVIFSGCSAGARGAMFNIDYIQAMLPAGSPPVVGFFDSPLWIDVMPALPDIMPLQNETMLVYAMVNATARLGAECAAYYPADERWKCLFGEYRLQFVKTPYLMSASQFDKYQLPYNVGGFPVGGKHPPMYTGANLTFAASFQEEVRGLVLNLPTPAQRSSAVFSSACFLHCTSTLAAGAFWGVKVDGVSLKEYLGAWYFGGEAPSSASAGAAALPAPLTKQLIESCNGFGCGVCHSNASHGPAPPLPPAYRGYGTVLVPPGDVSGDSMAAAVFGRRSGWAGARGGGAAGARGREVEHALAVGIAAVLTCVAALAWLGRSGGGGGAGGGAGASATKGRAPVLGETGGVGGGGGSGVRPHQGGAGSASGVELGAVAIANSSREEAAPLLLRVPVARSKGGGGGDA